MIVDRPKWQRRSLAIAVLIAGLALVWSVLVWPMMTYASSHLAWRASALDNLARYQAMVDKKDAFDEALASARQNELWQRLYGAESAPVATGQLQTDARALLDPEHVVLESLQPLDVRTDSGVTRIGVRLAFRTRVDQLALILRKVDTGTKLLQIDELVVASEPYQPSDTNAELRIRMEVWGFLELREPAS